MVSPFSEWAILSSDGKLARIARKNSRCRLPPSYACRSRASHFAKCSQSQFPPLGAALPCPQTSIGAKADITDAIMGLIGWCISTLFLGKLAQPNTRVPGESTTLELPQIDHWQVQPDNLASVYQWVSRTPLRGGRTAYKDTEQSTYQATPLAQYPNTCHEKNETSERDEIYHTSAQTSSKTYKQFQSSSYFLRCDEIRQMHAEPYQAQKANSEIPYVDKGCDDVNFGPYPQKRFAGSFLHALQYVVQNGYLLVQQYVHGFVAKPKASMRKPYVIVPEYGYGAGDLRERSRSRDPLSRSHSSSSDRRVGRWLMAGLNPEESDPWVEPSPPRSFSSTRRSRRMAPTRPSSRPSRGSSRSRSSRSSASTSRSSDTLVPEHIQADGPPQWWGEVDEDMPNDRPPSLDSRDFDTSPMWEKGTDGQWRLLVRWGSPQGILVHVKVTQEFPLAPKDIERMAKEQFPGLTENLRLGLVDWKMRGLQDRLPHDQALIHEPDTERRPYIFIPERGYGAEAASSSVAEAFRLVRQHGQLAMMADAKVLRTMLAAQPKTVEKVIAATSAGERYDVLLAGYKKAGMASLVHASVPRPGNRARVTPLSPPPPEPRSENPPSDQNPLPGRWQRRNQPIIKDGWQKVERPTRRNVTFSLADEWTVVVSPSLRLHQSGIVWFETTEDARRLADQLRGTMAPSAIASRQRIDGLMTVHRMGFHLVKSTPGKEDVTVPVVGWIHQLSTEHKVALRRAPQVYSLAGKGDTLVVKLLAAPEWTPADLWQQLQKGKISPLREEVIRLLQTSAPGQVGSIQDAFRPELRGKTVGCNLRVATSALKPLLSCSGQSWIFVHPMGETIPSYPTVWTGQSHPTELEPFYQRARDAGALGLTIGERHIGYRVAQEAENSVRQQLDSPAKTAWLLAGVPLAYSVCEANQILGDLGVQGHVAENTRRVGRGGQNWLVYLQGDANVSEDVLQIAHDGKQHFVTFAPLRNKEQAPRANIWQRVPQKSPQPRSWSDVVQNKAPKREETKTDPATQRLQHLEQLVSALVALLQAPGAPPLPPAVQSLVTELGQPPRTQPPPAAPSDDPEHEEEEQDSFPPSDSELQDDEDMTEDRGHKRQAPTRVSAPSAKKIKEPAQDDVSLFWGYVDPGVFQHVMWGRVRGDGNCFWRAACQSLDKPWQEVKTQSLQMQEQIKGPWKQCFHTDDNAWNTLMQAQAPDAYANEACCSLLAHAYGKPVVVVGVGQVFATWTQDEKPDWEDMLVFKLQKEHYSPMLQDTTVSMVRTMHSVARLHTPVFLSGGGSITQACSWNVDSLQSKLHEVLGMSAQVVLAQETGLTARAQKHVAYIAEQQGWKVYPGEPVPMGRNKLGRWRAQKAEVPGVAFVVQSQVRAGPVRCLTDSGRWLERRGRFGWLRVGLTLGCVLMGNVYMPTGDTQQAV